MNIVIATQSIRYRREIKLWQSFTVRTAIIGYNDNDQSLWVQSWFEEIPEAHHEDANANPELTEKGKDAGVPIVLAVHILKYVVIPSAIGTKATKATITASAAAAATNVSTAITTSDTAVAASTASSAANSTSVSRTNSDADDIWNRPRRASSACEARESGRRKAALAALNSPATSVTELRQIQRYLRATANMASDENHSGPPVLPHSYKLLSSVEESPTVATAPAAVIPAPLQALKPSQILASVGLNRMVPGRDCAVKGNVPAVDAVDGMNLLY